MSCPTGLKVSTQRCELLLLNRAHARRRWENQPAVDVTLDVLDHEEILRTREAAIQQRRISAGTSTDVGDILDRLGLRRGGVITQAAQILYGKRFLPDYPQGMLKLGRFRGTKITGDILDNRQEHLHAFGIVREAMSWLDRTLPLAAHFPPGQIFREDRLPVPPEALRYGMEAPTFEERAGAVYVIFRAAIGPTAAAGHQVGTKSALSEQQVQVLAASL